MEARPLHQDSSPPPAPVDWERFYRDYRKPGFIRGYEIGHKLGGGVFGIVYKARKESIGKAYAIKFLRVDDAHVREQVMRELESVKLFAQVDHPNLVSIEDQGLVDSVPYIIMGYGGEETLRDRLAEKRLSEEETLQVVVQVLRGVKALHDRSLVHFDLKPANIFLRGDVARVGDYGLSKLVSESCKSLSMGRGTPYYMAPEMLHRRGDHRSDIYSLGVIFFECLTGDVPFTGETEWEVLKQHEEGELVFPDAVSARLRPVLAKMLAKEPEDRFQSVGEALEALRAPESFGDTVDVEALTRGRSGTSVAPRRSAIAVGIGLAVLVGVFVAIFAARGGITGASGLAVGPPVILIIIAALGVGLAVYAAKRARTAPRSAGRRRFPVILIVLPALIPIFTTMRSPSMKWLVIGVAVAVAVGVSLFIGERSQGPSARASNGPQKSTVILTVALSVLMGLGMVAYLLYRA